MRDSDMAVLQGSVRDLARELMASIAGEVRFDGGSRALYVTDASNYRQVPIGVVIPRNVDDIVATVRLARVYGLPILGRGCGTSLAGQCCNAAVVIDTSKYFNRVLEIDPRRRIARVEPGAILDDLRAAAAAYGLTFGLDPATHSHSTLGGMIGNHSCGMQSVMAEFYGPGPRSEDNVAELEVLTYDGARLRVGPTSVKEIDSIIVAGGRGSEICGQMVQVLQLALRHNHQVNIVTRGEQPFIHARRAAHMRARRKTGVLIAAAAIIFSWFFLGERRRR